MEIENKIFKTYTLNKDKLIDYGFIKEDYGYKYLKKIMHNTFQAIIVIDENGIVSGKIYDLEAECEYTNFRVKDVTGEFALTVREEYENILKDIRDKCFSKKYFIYNQSNRIADYIGKKYNVLPEFLWKKFPQYGVFRNSKSNKWFGVIMNIDKSKIASTEKGEIEVINLKLDDLKYLERKGVYPAYHMNKKSWVSIVLDDTLKDEEIIDLIDISYEYSDIKDEWVIPANLKYFDVISYIESLKVFSWRQPKNIKLNDIIYIYLGSPYSAIMYKGRVIELDIYNDAEDRVMNIELLEKYDAKKYTFSKLKEYGLNSVRSPRRIPSKLAKILNK